MQDEYRIMNLNSHLKCSNLCFPPTGSFVCTLPEWECVWKTLVSVSTLPANNHSLLFLSIITWYAHLKILDSLTRRDYFNKGRENYDLPWYGDYHGKRSGGCQRPQKTHRGSTSMEFSFLLPLTACAAVRGTTCLWAFPTPAVAQVWNLLDAFWGQLQQQMAWQPDSGDRLPSFSRFCFQHHGKVSGGTRTRAAGALWWSEVTTQPGGDNPSGFRDARVWGQSLRK